jgi:hypothetical protein
MLMRGVMLETLWILRYAQNDRNSLSARLENTP